MENEKTQELNTIVAEIIKIRDRIDKLSEEKDDQIIGNEIARDINKLDILLINLSPLLNKLKEELNFLTYKQAKVQTDTYFKERKLNSQKDAEMLGKAEATEILKEKIPLESQYNTIKDFRDEVRNFVQGLRSRLSWLKSEKII